MSKHFECQLIKHIHAENQRLERMFYYSVYYDSLLVPTSGFVEMSFMHFKRVTSTTSKPHFYKER